MNEKTLRVLEYNKIIGMLVEEASSKLGKKLVVGLLPSNDMDEIKNRLAETSEITEIMVREGRVPLGPIFDISSYIKICEIGSYLNPKQLLEVGDTLRTARTLKNFIRKFNEEELRYPILGTYADLITSYRDIEERIERTVIGENEISDNASPELRSIRRDIERKNDAIRKKLDAIVSSQHNQKYLQDNIITIRQDRFVVPVKSEHKNQIKGLVHDQSASGATLYIEPMAIVEMNNQLKELKLQEQAEIERILMEISGIIGEAADPIRANQENLIILDFIIAKGKLSLKMKGIEPQINSDGRFRIRNGRHPLIDPKEVVPSNIWLGDEFHTLLVTGPNTGGKTVTLKTVGLLTLMTQAGIHIPADYGTEMAVFGKVFADIGDEQSIEQSLSTFSSHMTNIVEIVEHVDENSLVLLDELGAGTDPTEGAALAMAILSRLHADNVRTVASTHYSELKEFAIVTDGVENACVEFDVATLSPTYKLLIGVPGKSNAFEISRKLGLHDDVIEHAKIFVHKDNIEFEEVLSEIEENRRASEDERDEAIRLRLDVEKLKKRLAEKEAKLTTQRERIISEAKTEAKAMLKQAKQESEEIIKELRGMSVESSKERNRKIEEMRKKMKDGLGALEEPLIKEQVDKSRIPKKLTVGQSVKIANLDQMGTVVTVPDQNGDLVVQAGIMKINVNIKNLLIAEEDKPKKGKKAASSKQFASKAMGIETEIDIRGLNVEEARIELDKYLDDAYLSNLETVRIIHGKGTGALKSGLKDFFRRHPHIKSFRDGEYGEGGTGVTVVTLK